MSTTVTVTNSTQLAAALKAASTATSPETILLAAGTYAIADPTNYNPTATVTIESASSSNQAVIDNLAMSHSSNFTFNDVTFTTMASKPTAEVASFYFDNNLNFTNDTFTGAVQGSGASAPSQGLVIADSTNSTISNSVFEYVQNGLTQKENNGITVQNNTFKNLFGDGIDNAASSNVNISNNFFTNMHIDSSDTQHSDCIQFWTSGETTAGSNITINGNAYNIGSGSIAQGIFMTDQAGDLTYSNVTIENNDLVGTDWNGITLQHVSNAVVENNTLQTVAGTGVTSRLTLDGGVSGIVENNKIGQLINQYGNTATVSGDTTQAAISLASAQSLVSSMASMTSSTSSSSVTSTTTSTTTTTTPTITNNPHGNGKGHAVSL